VAHAGEEFGLGSAGEICLVQSFLELGDSLLLLHIRFRDIVLHDQDFLFLLVEPAEFDLLFQRRPAAVHKIIIGDDFVVRFELLNDVLQTGLLCKRLPFAAVQMQTDQQTCGFGVSDPARIFDQIVVPRSAVKFNIAFGAVNKAQIVAALCGHDLQHFFILFLPCDIRHDADVLNIAGIGIGDEIVRGFYPPDAARRLLQTGADGVLQRDLPRTLPVFFHESVTGKCALDAGPDRFVGDLRNCRGDMFRGGFSVEQCILLRVDRKA